MTGAEKRCYKKKKPVKSITMIGTMGKDSRPKYYKSGKPINLEADCWEAKESDKNITTPIGRVKLLSSTQSLCIIRSVETCLLIDMLKVNQLHL